jgi:hypothetical protein
MGNICYPPTPPGPIEDFSKKSNKMKLKLEKHKEVEELFGLG